MITYIFPGQGSQVKGMGKNLFEQYPILTARADEILGYSIQELCLDDPTRELHKTQFTQPALYVVNALAYYARVDATGVKPNYVAGHSLGEFNALLAAECFDFETGLQLVKKRGELMSHAPEGGMAAILNASREQIETILSNNNFNNIDLANYNTPSQIVISGSLEEIGKAQAFFQDGEIAYYPLNTSGAFHSRFMIPIKENFSGYLKQFTFSDPAIPVIANVTARPYERNRVIENLSLQISSAVKWSDSIQYLIHIGQASGKEMEFQEIGYGDVLSKMVTKIKDSMNKLDHVSSGVIHTLKGNTRENITGVENNSFIATKKWFVETDEVHEMVASWNKTYPVGTRVKSLVVDCDELETCTEAKVLFGHRAAIYIKNYTGYFDLKEIIPQ